MTEPSEPTWPAQPALFLDLDGTVLEFADTPDAVQASDALRRVLGDLAAATGGAIAFVSGRRIDALDRLLAPHRFAAAGIHGLERRDPAGATTRAAGFDRPLAGVRRRLQAWSAEFAGTLVEDKELSVAFHFRQRPDLAQELAVRFADLGAKLDPELEVLRGHDVYEIKPRVSDKGRAIEAFMQEAPFAGRTPVFVGDDLTDEHGFEIVNALGGLSVKVGNGRSQARERLTDVDAVIGWLDRLIARETDPRRRESE